MSLTTTVAKMQVLWPLGLTACLWLSSCVSSSPAPKPGKGGAGDESDVGTNGGMGGTVDVGGAGGSHGGMGGTVDVGGAGGSNRATGGTADSSSDGGMEETGGIIGTPSLTALTLSAGTLSPNFNSDVTNYTVRVPLETQTVSLIPTVSAPASIAINGTSVTSGAAWQSPDLNLGVSTITIVVSRSGQTNNTYTVTVTRGDQQAYLKASNTGVNDEFGYVVSLSADGNTLVVGAPGEDSNGRGVNGDSQSNNSAKDSGAVYVFSRSGAAWAQQAYLKASNTDADDWFGWSVSLSADGNTLAVGAYLESSNGTGVNNNAQANNDALFSGAVYVFARTGTAWSQQAYLKASNTDVNDRFGGAVSLSADGNTLVVGAELEDGNGSGVNSGPEANNGAKDSGAVYVFARTGTAWSQQAYVKASNTGDADYFGSAVSLSADGRTFSVGAEQEDSNGSGVGSNAQADNSMTNSGAVYVFARSGMVWIQQAYVKASNTGADDWFGGEVSLSADGSTLAVGAVSERSNGTGVNSSAQADDSAVGSGAVYVFARTGTAWAQQAYVKASNTGTQDGFGRAVSLSADGNTLAVGAIFEGSNGIGVNSSSQANDNAKESGATYVFTRVGPKWSQRYYVKASNTGKSDRFGAAVSLSSNGGTLAVGGYHEDSNGNGVNSEAQLNDSAAQSGAVYVFSWE